MISQRDRTHNKRTRQIEAFNLRLEGKTYKEIGEILGGVTATRAMQLSKAARRYAFHEVKIKWPEDAEDLVRWAIDGQMEHVSEYSKSVARTILSAINSIEFPAPSIPKERAQ